MVLAHAHALLVSSPQGATAYVEADARDVDAIVGRAAATLDFSRPVAVTMLGILPFIGDDAEARQVVAGFLAAVPPGSYLAVTHSTSEASGARVIEAVRQWNEVAPTPYTLRSPARIAAFFDGLELVEPGLVPVPGGGQTPMTPTAAGTWTSTARWAASSAAVPCRRGRRPGMAGQPAVPSIPGPMTARLPHRSAWHRPRPLPVPPLRRRAAPLRQRSATPLDKHHPYNADSARTAEPSHLREWRAGQPFGRSAGDRLAERGCRLHQAAGVRYRDSESIWVLPCPDTPGRAAAGIA